MLKKKNKRSEKSPADSASGKPAKPAKLRPGSITSAPYGGTRVFPIAGAAVR